VRKFLKHQKVRYCYASHRSLPAPSMSWVTLPTRILPPVHLESSRSAETRSATCHSEHCLAKHETAVQIARTSTLALSKHHPHRTVLLCNRHGCLWLESENSPASRIWEAAYLDYDRLKEVLKEMEATASANNTLTVCDDTRLVEFLETFRRQENTIERVCASFVDCVSSVSPCCCCCCCPY
jgi:hypothetical protein